MPDQKMLRQVMPTAEIYSHGEAIIEMLRDHYGMYDADSLEEVLVDDNFIQRLKAKGYELLQEGDPRAERGASRRPLPRSGAPLQRGAADGGGRLPGRNGAPLPSRPGSDRPQGSERPQSGPSRPAGSTFRSSSSDGANGAGRPRPGNLPLRPIGPITTEPIERPVAGAATPVPDVPAAELPEVPPLPPLEGVPPPVAAQATQAQVAPAQPTSVEAPQAAPPTPSTTAPTASRTSAAPQPTASVASQPAPQVAPVMDAAPAVPEPKPAPRTRRTTTTPKAEAALPADAMPAPKTRRTRKTVDPNTSEQ